MKIFNQQVVAIKIKSLLIILIPLLYCGCNNPSQLRVDGENISIDFNSQLQSRVISKINDTEVYLGDFSFSEFITKDNGEKIRSFEYSDYTESKFQDEFGEGKKFVISGNAESIQKSISIKSYDAFPSLLTYSVTYKNTGETKLDISGWTNNSYTFTTNSKQNTDPPFWSYQPGTYGWDNDWVKPINAGFKQENYLGMNREDYGGGTPIVDIWNKNIGLAVGHLESVPKQVSLPTKAQNNKSVEVAVTYDENKSLNPGESFATFVTFVSVHKGDYFKTLTDYSKFMANKGYKFEEAPESSYGTEWCGWGFEENFTMEEFYGAFPMVKKLDIDWITLDMGWENKNYGLYHLPEKRFPNGDASMKKIVKNIHEIGAKARLWWTPLSVHPTSDLFAQNADDYMIFDKEQSPVYIHFWESFMLCPASEKVQQITKDFVKRAIGDWGWDGLKIDGNHLNAVPPCYNPAHNHKYPEESVEALPKFYKMIYETAKSINPNVVIQICPCGTNQSFYNLPYMNQTVASDPQNSWQVRTKGKTLMGLTRGRIPYAGDHVELSNNRNDFASTVGIGGVIATKFTWPVGAHENQETGDIALTTKKKKKWAKWIRIYNENMLSKGNYLGELYDIGYDRPETHAIKKNEAMYYAFYNDNYKGKVELRGLENKAYRIVDYENNVQIGEVHGPRAKLPVEFEKHLLIKAEPK